MKIKRSLSCWNFTRDQQPLQRLTAPLATRPTAPAPKHSVGVADTLTALLLQVFWGGQCPCLHNTKIENFSLLLLHLFYAVIPSY